jgi:Flp pilus assembly protein TadG
MLSSFLKDRRGGVAPMFAIAVIPIFGLVGAAVDYSRANSVRTGMQSAIDATALAMARLAPTLTQAQLQQQTTAYFSAMFPSSEAKNLVVTPTYTTAGGSQLTITVSGSVDTSFMKIMGMSSLNVGSKSTVKWGNSRLRVALVLDNTGSMADDGKMAALKDATNKLLNQLKDATTTNGDVYVSIVPFAKDVNVDPSNKSANWVDWTDWDAKNGTCKNYSGWSTPNSESSCDNAGGNWKKAKHSTWTGCVEDRGNSNAPNSGNYDTNVVAPSSSNTATQFPAEQYSDCPQAVMPLNYNWSTMTTLVNNMQPAGNTNQAIGLAHGWMSLVGGGPYPTPPAMDPNYTYNQVIILLTDGLNTEDRWYTSQNSIDNREKLTCDNINAANITLYTIQVNTGGDPVSTLLKNCAGTAPSGTVARKYPDPDKNFVVTASSGIGTVFNQIGTQLSKLRISK